MRAGRAWRLGDGAASRRPCISLRMGRPRVAASLAAASRKVVRWWPVRCVLDHAWRPRRARFCRASRLDVGRYPPRHDGRSMLMDAPLSGATWPVVVRNLLRGRAPACGLASHVISWWHRRRRPPLRRSSGDVVTADFF
ncbi:hypothetical protein F511_45910 [Dorcoceras hygrometricum]|uniref:Uncharacterized protein n=1 Tax=Dorcoceras hygrometricum TaxID=472368 RepID=A0A2Z6ZUW2_9LAMI|nr:hypothetical protein F511_45910 [Dorcoceras hygrometricum]